MYITIQEVRDQGVTVAKASDKYVAMLILAWQNWIDHYCRQWFEPREMTWDRDGNGTTLMQLPVPIISLESLYVNRDFDNALDVSRYKVYAGRGGGEGDDRKNPRIKILTTSNSIFDGTGDLDSGGLIFQVGEKNQRLVGTFGYVEPDGSTPRPVALALLKLVVRSARAGLLGNTSSLPTGPVIEEETDRHRKKYADTVGAGGTASTSGDPEVDMFLAAFRGPLLIGAPRSMGRRLVGGSGTVV